MDPVFFFFFFFFSFFLFFLYSLFIFSKQANLQMSIKQYQCNICLNYHVFFDPINALMMFEV
jgi:hypothetical protein